MKSIRDLKKKIVVFGLALSSIALTSCSGSFSTRKLKKVELGTSQKEVEKMLGTPHEKNDSFGEKWYYFDNSFKGKYESVMDLLENGETEADFEKADKLYTELEKMTYKCTMIKFNGDKKVTEVFYDAKHKYEEDNDYATTSKTSSEVKLSIADVQYYVEETEEGSSTKILNTNDSLSYEVTFNDGSYMHSYAKSVKTTLEGNSAIVTWKDEISNYKVNKKANKIGTFKDNGDFTLEYAKGDLVLPDGVTEIIDEMFLNNNDLTSIVIPDSVKRIGKNAFKGCSKLTSVFIPNGVESIEDGAFQNCESLKDITIERGSVLNHIGKIVFKNTSVNFETLEGGKYLSCGDNKYFALVSIDNGQQNLTIKAKTNVIADDVFDNFNGNAINFENYGIKCVKTDDGFELTECLNTSITSLVIPNFIISVKWGVLENCTQLESITLPFVGSKPNEKGAYFGYIFGASSYDGNSKYVPSSLKEVIITGRTSIGYSAFENCSSLTSIVIPNSVTSIGYSAFENCSSLTSIVIPNSVTSIGHNAFENCSSLTSIVIPNSVTSIGNSAFFGTSLQYNEYGNCLYLGNEENPYLVLVKAKDTSITEVTISNNTRIIMNQAFENCSSLTSITIPDSVTSIGDSAFYCCSSRLIVYCKINSEPTGWGDLTLGFNGTIYFGVNESNCINGVSYGIKSGKAAIIGYTNELPNQVVIPSSITLNGVNYSVTSIGNSAFSGCRSLKSIVIPDSVTSIGYSAFYGCSSLERLTLPWLPYSYGNEYKSFGYYFGTSSFVSGLPNNSLYVPSSLKEVTITRENSIPRYAFANCSSLTSITIPDSVTSIGISAFENCSSLTSIVIPNSVTSIGQNAFENCSSLTSVTFEENSKLTSIGNNAFRGCSSLTSIVIPNIVTDIGRGTFQGCSSLTSITIPDGVKYIGKYTFGYCSSLTSIVIPNSVISIEKDAFGYCISLTSITIPNSVIDIYECAFENCSSLTSIVIPNSVTSIGNGAFARCSSLTIYCEESSKSSGWSDTWAGSGSSVYWAGEWSYVNGVPTPNN